MVDAFPAPFPGASVQGSVSGGGAGLAPGLFPVFFPDQSKPVGLRAFGGVGQGGLDSLLALCRGAG